MRARGRRNPQGQGCPSTGNALAGATALAAFGWTLASAAAQSSGPPPSPPTKDSGSVPEVVIPDTYGAVTTDAIPPERQLTPVEIDTYGVSSIRPSSSKALKPETQT